MYKVELKLKDGYSTVAEGKTIDSALKKLKKPEKINTLGVLSVKSDKGNTERVVTVPKIKSIFNETTDIYRTTIAKSLQLFLK